MGRNSNCDMGRDKVKHSKLTIFVGFPNSSMCDIFLYVLSQTSQLILESMFFFIADNLKSCRALMVPAVADIGLASFILIHLVLPSVLSTIKVQSFTISNTL